MDYAGLGAKVLRPARPKLEAARQAVLGIKKPEHALEALTKAGLYTADPKRVFFALRGDDWRGWKVPKGKPVPPSVEACVAIAADPDGILAAERAAREYCDAVKALWPKFKAMDEIAWMFTDAGGGPYVSLGSRYTIPFIILNFAWDYNLPLGPKSPRALEAKRAAADAMKGHANEWQIERAGNEVLYHAAWAIACEEDKVVSDKPEKYPPAGKRFRDLPNPWDALLRIRALGYALDRDEKALVLQAPLP